VQEQRSFGEDGFALILVLTALVAVLLGGLAAVDYASGYLPLAHTDEAREAALAAAEAGVDDYVNRLNEDPSYWFDGTAATNVAMQGGGPVGGTIVPNTGAWGWVPVAVGSPDSFHYYVDVSDMTNYKETASSTGSWGSIEIFSTGKVGNVTRTIQVGVRPDFLSNMYLSQYSLVDPQMMVAGGWMSLAQAQACVEYGYTHNGNGTYGPQGCADMMNYWISGNVVNGPIQAYDDYYISGDPQFMNGVTTADPNNGANGLPQDSPYWLGTGSDSAFPHAAQVGSDEMIGPNGVGGGPIAATYQTETLFPPSANFLVTDNDVSATANASEGCLYYGPTWINFSTNASGVTSEYVYSPDTPSSNTDCLAPGDSPTTPLASLPFNGVIYVENLPPGDPCTVPTPSWAELGIINGSGCLGNAFVEGTANAQVTIGTDNNIYLVAPTGSTSTTIGEWSMSGGDLFGLAASNFIMVNHDNSGGPDSFGPAGCGTGSNPACPVTFAPVVADPTLNAVLFTVNDSLATSEFWEGGVLGTLTINGAIVSKFMDIEGTFSGTSLSNGYNEIYNWDTRLTHETPPYFIPPGQAKWVDTTYAEIPAENG
jgi:hypothetical protein